MFIEVKCLSENGNSTNTIILNKNYIVEVNNLTVLHGELTRRKACEIKLATGNTLRVLGKASVINGDFDIAEE